MNIAYTINGEGMGHATRSSVVIDYLVAQGHTVIIFSAGERPLAFLREKFSNVYEVIGTHMVYEDNRLRRLKTTIQVLNTLPGVRNDLHTIRQALKAKRPQVVITDFDFHGQIISSMFRAPVISIDNIQFLNLRALEPRAKDIIDYELNLLVAKMMVPQATHYYVASFVPAELANTHGRNDLKFIPPFLRESVYQQTPLDSSNYVVYQTSDSYTKLLPILASLPATFIVYNTKRRVRSKNIIYRDFDFRDRTFNRDLAASAGFITNGGFSAISEALYYGKPVLSIPVAHHYEQLNNALTLAQQRFGIWGASATRQLIDEFIKKRSFFEKPKKKINFDTKPFFDDLGLRLQELAKQRSA